MQDEDEVLGKNDEPQDAEQAAREDADSADAADDGANGNSADAANDGANANSMGDNETQPTAQTQPLIETRDSAQSTDNTTRYVVADEEYKLSAKIPAPLPKEAHAYSGAVPAQASSIDSAYVYQPTAQTQPSIEDTPPSRDTDKRATDYGSSSDLLTASRLIESSKEDVDVAKHGEKDQQEDVAQEEQTQIAEATKQWTEEDLATLTSPTGPAPKPPRWPPKPPTRVPDKRKFYKDPKTGKWHRLFESDIHIIEAAKQREKYEEDIRKAEESGPAWKDEQLLRDMGFETGVSPYASTPMRQEPESDYATPIEQRISPLQEQLEFSDEEIEREKRLVEKERTKEEPRESASVAQDESKKAGSEGSAAIANALLHLGSAILDANVKLDRIVDLLVRISASLDEVKRNNVARVG